MKNLLFLFVTVGILLSTTIGCEKDPKEAMLPDDVEFQLSIFYLNGEEAEYIPSFAYDSTIQVMTYSFAEVKNQGQLINHLGFGLLRLEKGDFDITSGDDDLFIKAFTSFNQTVSEDLEGYEYKLMDADEGFFNVEYLDTINMEVKGRFKAKFCRTKKNGTDGELPKNIVFQGVFYENYVFK